MLLCLEFLWELRGLKIGKNAIGLKICAITEGIKKYKSTIKKNKQEKDKIVFLAKSKLNGIKALISKAIYFPLFLQGNNFLFLLYFSV